MLITEFLLCSTYLSRRNWIVRPKRLDCGYGGNGPHIRHKIGIFNVRKATGADSINQKEAAQLADLWAQFVTSLETKLVKHSTKYLQLTQMMKKGWTLKRDKESLVLEKGRAEDCI